MRLTWKSFIVIGMLIASMALTAPSAPHTAAEGAVEHFRTEADSFARAAAVLYRQVQLLEKDTSGADSARRALVLCRRQYKKIESFLTYFFFSESTVFNAPPKYEIEEPYMEYQHPAGMQVLEALLYEKDLPAHRKELEEQAELVSSSAAGLTGLLYNFSATDAQLLESIRLELVRVIALHISGYDAPFLQSGVAEAAEALASARQQLQPFFNSRQPFCDSTAVYINSAIQYLQQPVSFNQFNRLTFLRSYMLPLQRWFGLMVQASGQTLHTTSALDYGAANLFEKDALDLSFFDAAADTSRQALLALGKLLFVSKALSGNNQRSCITCHQPDKYFSDNLITSPTFTGTGALRRNTPSLLYAGYQHAQFWDGRAHSLEQQVRTVMLSPDEMHADTIVAMHRLQQQKIWDKSFSAAFPKESAGITMDKTARAIAAYVRSLAPFNAPFDRYLKGEDRAMTATQQWGFNLFMGKAQCGTCHFAPLFNGLTPPEYQLTEFEVLGTTATANLQEPISDTDKGRYEVFPITFYRQAFKTPTVRNAAVTAPYMHNGIFATLEEVIEFYDKGGGAGVGIATDNQTLSAAPLLLTAEEKKALVSFMETLTDDKSVIK